jgi:tetratricopeptide (TPR) repeat protein
VFDRVIAILERALGASHPDVAQALGNAMGVHLASGKLDRAAELLLRSIAILEQHDPTNVLLGSSLNNLGEVRRMQGDLAEAERLHIRALALRRQHLGEHHPQVTQSLLSLASLALARGDVAAAGARCDQASRAIAGSDAGDRAVRGTVETCRGEVELAAGRPANAVAILERALALHQGAEDPARLADTQFALARALPASEARRAIELARAARAGFVTERAFRKGEVEQVDAWLRRHER